MVSREVRPGRVKRELGRAVRDARLAAGLTQAALARKARLCNAAVAGIEQGRRLGTVATFLQLAAALDVCPGVLMLGVYERAFAREE